MVKYGVIKLSIKSKNPRLMIFLLTQNMKQFFFSRYQLLSNFLFFACECKAESDQTKMFYCLGVC